MPSVGMLFNVGAKLFERHKVPVDLAFPNIVATKRRNEGLARAVQQRAAQQDRDTTAAGEFPQAFR